MYRYEFDNQRKIVVLVVHGTQDGWEARLMKIEWPLLMKKTDADWTLILDLDEYVSPVNDAPKEQAKISGLIASQSLKQKFFVPAPIEAANKPFMESAEFKEFQDFLSAWHAAGGDPRNRLIAPPAVGKYQANNPPPPIS